MEVRNQLSNNRWPRFVLFFISVVWVIGLIVSGQNNYSTAQGSIPSIFADDVYDIPEAISSQEREYAASISLGGAAPIWDRTSDYMIGTVVVGLVLPESNGNDRNWTSSEIADVVQETQQSLNWWKAQANSHGIPLNFILHQTTPPTVPTIYEPINLVLGPPDNTWCGNDDLWINDVMAYLGYSQFSDYVMNVRDYANALRDMYSADWAFIVFVADADPADSGAFEPSQPPCSAPPLIGIAYRPGPMYITNDDPASIGAALLDELMRHEQGHIFGASDEVPGAWPDCYQAGSCSQGFGYLNASNGNCRYVGYETPPPPPTPVCSTDIFCVMQAGGDGLCPSSEKHIGWRDSNANGIPDPIDTTPDLSVTAYPTNPSSSPLLSYQAIAEDIPYPTNHPDFVPVTINNVYVEYKWTNTTTGQSSDWAKTAAGDGAWNSPYEEDFSILICQNGNYNIQLRAVNEVGNISSIIQHTITINLSSSCETSSLPVVFNDEGSQNPPQSSSPSYSEPYPAPSTPTPPPLAYP